MRPVLLDAFCGAGGAAVGYDRAGFQVVGVDIEPQPRYPFEFIQADAMQVLQYLADDAEPWEGAPQFDAIHASPPCQDHIRSGMMPVHGTGWMLAATRKLLVQIGKPWVIENVPGAPMRPDLVLCGCVVGLDELKRKRWFETWPQLFDLRPPCNHQDPPVGVYGHPRGGKPGETWGWGTYDDWCRAMGIDWMTGSELAQAIPPAYAEYVGHRLYTATPDNRQRGGPDGG